MGRCGFYRLLKSQLILVPPFLRVAYFRFVIVKLTKFEGEKR
jgi:hypothetical protein